MTTEPRVALTTTQTAHRVPGGTATSVLALLDALVDAGGVELTAVVAAGELRRPRSWFGRQGAELARPGLRVRSARLPVPLLYEAWARTGRPHVAEPGSTDLVHVTVPMRVGVGEVPVVATVHDLFPLTRPEQLTPRGVRLMAPGLRWVLDTARAVMVPSATVRDECEAHGVPGDRLHVVPWGATPRRPDPAEVRAVRTRHGLTGPYVLFVGTVEPRKNLPGLLAAMAALDRPDLTLAVVGPAGWGDGIEDAAAALAGPVARLGHVPEGDLGPLYAGAAVVALPSFAEGFGLPVLEAMASGAPVVTSKGTATADVAGDAALLVDPHDTASLAAALARVLDDDALAARLVAAGRVRAAQHRWSDAAAATLAVYRSVLGR